MLMYSFWIILSEIYVDLVWSGLIGLLFDKDFIRYGKTAPPLDVVRVVF